MKKNIKRLVASGIVCATLVGGIALAKTAEETIKVYYNNIKILIDGVEFQPTDANGRAIEPFIYNGTTYLPVRGIADAFDKEVNWDSATSTVSLGTTDFEWLDQKGYITYDVSGPENTMSAWEKGKKATDGMIYDRGLIFDLGYNGNNGAIEDRNTKEIESYQKIEYLLQNKYRSFTGVLCCINANQYQNSKNCIVEILGDGEQLYKSPVLSRGTKSVEFDVDVLGCDILTINVYIDNATASNSGASHIGITDAKLLK